MPYVNRNGRKVWMSQSDYDRRYGSDNAGDLGVDFDGDLTVGLGNGLGIDTSDGSLEIEVFPGVYIDTDGD